MASNIVHHSDFNPMSNTTLASASNTQTSSYSAMELSIAQERLRQARYSFNIALVFTTLFASISIIGAGLLLSGKVSQGSLTTAGGAISSVGFMQLAKDANDRLDKILIELKDED
jgi:hypothetical protein